MSKNRRNPPIANVLNLGHTERSRPVWFHHRALEFIREQGPEIRLQIGEAIRNLQRGLILQMPLSRPMPGIAPGVDELRVKDQRSSVRVFYLARSADAVIVFHGFEKRSQKTPQQEIELGRKRLQELQQELMNE